MTVVFCSLISVIVVTDDIAPTSHLLYERV